MNIQRASGADEGSVRYLVSLHIAAFPGFFLTSLGPRFLNLLYSNYLSSSECICLVARNAEDVSSNPMGVAVAITNPSAFYKRLLRTQGFKFFFYAIPCLLKNPGNVVKKLASALFYKGDASEEVDTSNAVLLSTISVSPDAQGLGVGGKLLQGIEEVANQSKFDFIYLITDRDSNDPVNAFYLKNGYVLDAVLSKSGNRFMNRYIKTLGV